MWTKPFCIAETLAQEENTGGFYTCETHLTWCQIKETSTEELKERPSLKRIQEVSALDLSLPDIFFSCLGFSHTVSIFENTAFWNLQIKMHFVKLSQFWLESVDYEIKG